MSVVRVYVPLGRSDLVALDDGGSLPAGPARPRGVFAVTAELERSAPGLDLEDLEYAAFSDAVVAASRAREVAGDRRVVAAADVDPSWVAAANSTSDAESVSAMVLSSPLPLARVASFHLDEEGPSSASADSTGEADELLWYDATELDEVRGFFA